MPVAWLARTHGTGALIRATYIMMRFLTSSICTSVVARPLRFTLQHNHSDYPHSFLLFRRALPTDVHYIAYYVSRLQ